MAKPLVVKNGACIMIERIGPVCRFGPGGDYESVWPGEWMEQATQPKNAIGRLLDVIAGMTDVIRGGNRCVEVTGPIDISDGLLRRRTSRMSQTKEEQASGEGLTPRQVQLLSTIAGFRTSRGYLPTIGELAQQLSISRTTAFGHIEQLRRKGLVSGQQCPSTKARARSLNLTSKARRRLKQIPCASSIMRRRTDLAIRNTQYHDEHRKGFPLWAELPPDYPLRRSRTKITFPSNPALAIQAIYSPLRSRATVWSARISARGITLSASEQLRPRMASWLSR